MTYLLDTNVFIALMRGAYPSVRARYARAVREGDLLATSAIVAFELWYGVEKSVKKTQNAEAVAAVLSGLQVLAFDDDDAAAAGAIRTALEATGSAIGAYDVLIAGTAVNRNLTLVTANATEFSRVPALIWEDWSR